MAMLIDGVWSETDEIIKNGVYVRQQSIHDDEINDETIFTISSQPGRFSLIASWSCPWSHRVMLIRRLKGLDDHMPLHMTGGKRIQGYPANFGKKWKVPGTNNTIIHLHQLYCLNNPQHTGRPTVPVLWDSQEHKIISDESAKIMRAFDAITLTNTKNHLNLTFVPQHLVEEINTINEIIYINLSNGVYRSGFAESQQAYDEAVDQVFNMLEELENHLAESRYLFGEIITESDLRLFPTLVRFDLDYFLHSRCSIRRLVDYPNLWAYARDLYSIKGVAETIDFDAINMSNHRDKNVISRMPITDWLESHGREKFGSAKITLKSGGYVSAEQENHQVLVDW